MGDSLSYLDNLLVCMDWVDRPQIIRLCMEFCNFCKAPIWLNGWVGGFSLNISVGMFRFSI